MPADIRDRLDSLFDKTAVKWYRIEAEGEANIMIKEKKKKSFKERRKYPRVKENIAIEIADQKDRIAATIMNFSSCGIYCQTSREMPLFREVQMVIALPHIVTPIECSGVVVRSEKASDKKTYNMAIFFDDIEPEDKKKVAVYVNKKLGK